MARGKISNNQAVFSILFWGFLCYLLITSREKFTFDVIFAIVASGIIVFVPLYKNIRNRNKEE